MKELTEQQKKEYFRRSYTAADGLWFMKAEEAYGFDEALLLDEAVWKVLPKIQARMMRSMLETNMGLEGLKAALATRLELEGFSFQMADHENGFQVHVSMCPWHEIMKKSNRSHLSGKVNDLICGVENQVWAREFSPANSEEISFSRKDMMCKGQKGCILIFK